MHEPSPTRLNDVYAPRTGAFGTHSRPCSKSCRKTSHLKDGKDGHLNLVLVKSIWLLEDKAINHKLIQSGPPRGNLLLWICRHIPYPGGIYFLGADASNSSQCAITVSPFHSLLGLPGPDPKQRTLSMMDYTYEALLHIYVGEMINHHFVWRICGHRSLS